VVGPSEVDVESMALAQGTIESAGWAFALLGSVALEETETADVMEGREVGHRRESHMVRRRFRYMVELAVTEDAIEGGQLENVDAANKFDWAHEDYQVRLVAGENGGHHEGQQNDHLEKQLVTHCEDIAFAIAGLGGDRVIDVCSVVENNHRQSAEEDMQRAFLGAGWERVQRRMMWSMVSRADLTVAFSYG
jgi:hypothetical protein